MLLGGIELNSAGRALAACCCHMLLPPRSGNELLAHLPKECGSMAFLIN
jgi:hypothetical protein